MDIGKSIKDSIWDSVRGSAYIPGSIPIRISVYGSIHDSAGDLIYVSVDGSVRDSIWYPISDTVWYGARLLILSSRWI
jgi:hypothetical protein